LILCRGINAVLSTSAFKGREEITDLRQSLDPVDELLCMLSPLQVIYALKITANKARNFNSLINSIRVGQS